MRRALTRFGGASLASIAVVVVLASSKAALAAEADELPAGDDPPHLLPIAYVDTYYAYHDVAPDGREATLMSTASRHNEFAINLAAIGVRVEHAKLLGTVILQAGTSTDALAQSFGGAHYGATSNPEVWKHIQEANVGYRLSSDWTVQAGWMKSHFGNESFTSFDNWNYSRSMLADATPYYEMGVKLSWRIDPTFTIRLLAINGWQGPADVNKGKSGGLALEWTPSATFLVRYGGTFGPETVDEKVIRYFNDLVVGWRPHPRLQFAVEGAVAFDKGGGTSSKFWAGSVWARWFVGESTFFAIRGEHLSDPDAILTGTGFSAPNAPVAPILGRELTGGTFTIGHYLHPKLLARAEVVHRVAGTSGFFHSNQEFFASGNGAAGQSTSLIASLVFSY